MSAEGAGTWSPASKPGPTGNARQAAASATASVRPGGDDDDRRLIEAARAGDTAAFGALVRRHQDGVFGLVVRMVRDYTAAEELTQDVFMKAYRGLGRFRGEARFSTWLYRIAVNACRDHGVSRMERNRRLEIQLDDEESAPFDPRSQSPTPDAELELHEMERSFERALSRLEPTYRAPFLLRHQEGLGYAEIAAALDITRSNAKVRVHRAREMVLQELRASGYDV